jgi:hypothetical protein
MHGQRWPVVGSLVLSVLVLLAAAPRHAPFTLGILRRDGILLPFATYDGSWKNHWPAPGQQVNMPFAAADIPRGWWHDKQPILGWTLLALGPKPVTVHTVQVKGINWYRAACEQSVGLFTDYKPAILPPPLRVHPYPKDALAYSGDVKIDPIAIVPPTDKVVTLLQTLLPDATTAGGIPTRRRNASGCRSAWRRSIASREGGTAAISTTSKR